jgi:DNA-binding SARP family transcriptional activator
MLSVPEGGDDLETMRLTLMGEFELVISGRQLRIPHSAERVLTYLALADRSVARARLAGVLWEDGSDQGAAKSLRTTLWRIRHAGANVVLASDNRLRLCPEVTVDVTDLTDLARRLIHQPDAEALARLPILVECVELLPDWDDAWVVADRERYRLLRLEALERAASALMERCRLGDALIAALAAVHAGPLRESARRLMVQVQIAQGNAAEAIHSYREYRSLLRQELGLEPSPLIDQLIQPLTSPATVARHNHDLWPTGGMRPECHDARARLWPSCGGCRARRSSRWNFGSTDDRVDRGRPGTRSASRARDEHSWCLPGARGVAAGPFG